ncbi:MAG: hypothetical protein ACP5QA_16315, partial [Phycisphaerae bacterium]
YDFALRFYGCRSLYKIANLIVQAVLQACLQRCGGRWLQVVCWEGCHARAQVQGDAATLAEDACETLANVQYAACEARKCVPKIF